MSSAAQYYRFSSGSCQLLLYYCGFCCSATFFSIINLFTLDHAAELLLSCLLWLTDKYWLKLYCHCQLFMLLKRAKMFSSQRVVFFRLFDRANFIDISDKIELEIEKYVLTFQIDVDYIKSNQNHTFNYCGISLGKSSILFFKIYFTDKTQSPFYLHVEISNR